METKKTTQGIILNGGWTYDLMGWLSDALLFRGQWRRLRQKTLDLAQIHPGEQVLDVGCGTGTLAILAARQAGATGRVTGIDPGVQQIARARAKAARVHLPINFQIGVIEQIPFPDQSFDVVLSTLMMHHLPKALKQQGLAEIARVLKPGGRLIIADLKHRQDRRGLAAHLHAGGSRMDDLVSLVREAGFVQVETEEMPPKSISMFPASGFINANRSSHLETESR